MPSKKKSAAKAPADMAAAKPKAAAPAPPPPPPPPVLTLAELQAKIAETTKAKEENAAVGKALDDKLTRAFKAPPKRTAGITVAQIESEMERLELRRSTTSMSLNDEKYILRELQLLKDKKVQVEEFDKFQQWVEATRKDRQERFQQNRSFDEQLAQLQRGVRKAALAEKLGVAQNTFVTLDITVPDDKVGSVVGKGFAMARKIEADCDVLLDVEPKSNVVTITSVPRNLPAAQHAIEAISLATTHTVGLHPDTLKVLMTQKAKHLHELEQSLGLKIDINRADGTLSTQAAPHKAAQLDNALQELEASKAEIALPAEIVPKLIGKKGETINQLMDDTGCVIDIDKITNAVKLCGTKESVRMATQFVEALIRDQSQREQSFSVHDRTIFSWDEDEAAYKFHFFAEFLMSQKGQQLKRLRHDAADAKIKILKESQTIHVMGTHAQLTAVAEALRERLRVFETQHWLYEVADSYHLSLIIGKKGAKIKAIEEACADGHVKIEIHHDHVCVLGDSPSGIDQAKATILEIVEQNQRSIFTTSQPLLSVLFNNKRAKLNEIEKASHCKLHVPPGVWTGTNPSTNNRTAIDNGDKVKITVTGTREAIANAKHALETLDENHHVRYVPLDDDEVPTVIGKKGETISELEKSTGVKLRVVRDGGSAELEMLGTHEQLDSVQQQIDQLLQTSNRELLQLDPFATGCLIGKKGERIKTLRQAHPEVSVDAFPTRGQVRIKAATPAALKECVDHVLQLLRETLVVETVKVPSENSQTTTFTTILAKHPAIAARLQELEAQGGENTKVTIHDDGKSAKIRGPALAIGTLKTFLEMLVTLSLSDDTHFVETIQLPVAAFGSVLLDKSATTLNENALRICQLTGCEIRVKKQAVVIEGPRPAKVYNAKDQIQQILQFYHGEAIHILQKLPPAAVPRLYELLPTLTTKFKVVFSLVDKSSLRVFTDSKKATNEVVALLQHELAKWKQQHVEIPLPAWLVPVLVGKNGETIKKLAIDCNHAKLDLSASSSPNPVSGSGTGGSSGRFTGTPQEDRVLTISARDDATIQLAITKVKEFITVQQRRTSTLDVQKPKLDLVLSVKKELPSGVQLYINHATTSATSVQVVLVGGDHEAREAVIEKMEHLIENSVLETIRLPPHATLSSSIVGALIGKSGANIRALQKEYLQVKIDIQRDDSLISLQGPSDQVAQVKIVMEDKVEELLRQQTAFDERTRQAEDERNQQRRARGVDGGGRGGGGEGEKTKKEDENEPEEEAKPAAPVRPMPHVPVGSSGVVDLGKLTKNQRRRLRKRAENERE